MYSPQDLQGEVGRRLRESLLSLDRICEFHATSDVLTVMLNLKLTNVFPKGHRRVRAAAEHRRPLQLGAGLARRPRRRTLRRRRQLRRGT